MKALVIDRATWGAGQHLEGSSCLLTHHGQRCCIGILGGALGVPDADLLHRWYASTLRSWPWPEALFEMSPHDRETFEWQHVLAALNDERDIDDATRESWIATGFREVLGIEVTFTGEYPDGPRGEDGELL